MSPETSGLSRRDVQQSDSFEPESPRNELKQTGRTHVKQSPPSPRSKWYGRLIPTAIIHRSALFRAGLTAVLADSRFRITIQGPTLSDLADVVPTARECMVLVGIDNEDADFSSQILFLKARSSAVRIVALSKECRTEQLLAAIETGVDGYLIETEITPEVLLRALEVILLGGVVVPRGWSRAMKSCTPLLECAPAVNETSPPPRDPPQESVNEVGQSAELARLSNREQMILKEVMRGVSNKHIARALDITEATVKVHVKSLLRKLRVNNRTQAAMWGIDHLPKVLKSVALISSVVAAVP